MAHLWVGLQDFGRSHNVRWTSDVSPGWPKSLDRASGDNIACGLLLVDEDPPGSQDQIIVTVGSTPYQFDFIQTLNGFREFQCNNPPTPNGAVVVAEEVSEGWNQEVTNEGSVITPCETEEGIGTDVERTYPFQAPSGKRVNLKIREPEETEWEILYTNALAGQFVVGPYGDGEVLEVVFEVVDDLPNQYSEKARIVAWDVEGVSSSTVIPFTNQPCSAYFVPPSGSAQLLKYNPTIWVWQLMGIRSEDGFGFAPGTYTVQVLSEGVWVDVVSFRAEGGEKVLGVGSCLVQKFEGAVQLYREIRLSIIQDCDPPEPGTPEEGEFPVEKEGGTGGPSGGGPEPTPGGEPVPQPEPVEPPVPLPPDDELCVCSPWYSNIAEMLQAIQMTLEGMRSDHVAIGNAVQAEMQLLRGDLVEALYQHEVTCGDGLEAISQAIEEIDFPEPVELIQHIYSPAQAVCGQEEFGEA